MRLEKQAQSHLAAVRQRPGSNGDSSEYNNYHYHHNNHYRNNNHHGGYSSSSSGSATNDRHTVGGGTVSALSVSEYETQKQWDWLEEVLNKSSRNKETVRIY